ncbi:hypothetical protein MMC13_004277 [Lambiella insularis]|nr:hypothetical protein [Lambiella insularis]
MHHFRFLILLFLSALAYALPTVKYPEDECVPGTVGSRIGEHWTSLDARSSAPINATTITRRAHDFAPGWCGLHVRQYFGHSEGRWAGDPRSGFVDVEVKDAAQSSIGAKLAAHFNYGDIPGSEETARVDVYSELPYTLEVLMVGTGHIDQGDGRQLGVMFRYGTDEWDTWDEDRCKVGNVDDVKLCFAGVFVNSYVTVGWTRQMDCGFTC